MNLPVSGAPAVGDILPVIRQTVTQPMIDLYAVVSGDRNPLHIDPDFGRASAFGTTIAHGLMTFAIASRMMAAWDVADWGTGSELDIAFLGPVRPGEEVTVTGVVRSLEVHDGASIARCEISCVVGDRTVMAGTALRRLTA